MGKKQDLKSLTRSQLTDWFQDKGFKSFRAEQVFNWLYKNGVNNLAEMKNLPKSLQHKLEELSYITDITLKDRAISRDGTQKFLWQLADGELLESVYIPASGQKRHTVCISTQVGCSQGCKFCATGLMGFTRNLKPGEIVDQVVKIQNNVSENQFGHPPLSNIVFMGMGEPLQNYENLLIAINILNDEKGFNIGQRKITISTSGHVPGIYRLARDNDQLGLAVSLNAPTDELRNRLMPINRKYPLAELLTAVKEYIKITGRRITFEYVLIRGVNDEKTLARKLRELLKDIKCHINIIPANPVKELEVEPPPGRDIQEFLQILSTTGINVTLRKERGSDIKAACGQLKHDRG